jgi:transposase
MRGAAARFAVSPSSAIKLMAQVRATGTSAPARYGGHRRPLLAPHEDLLRELVDERPDITLAEIQAELRRERGIAVCLATIHVSLRRLGLRHKRSLRAAEQDRPDMVRRRRRWRVWQRYIWTRPALSSSTRPGSRPK